MYLLGESFSKSPPEVSDPAGDESGGLVLRDGLIFMLWW